MMVGFKRELADVEMLFHVLSWSTRYAWPGGGEPHPFVDNATCYNSEFVRP